MMVDESLAGALAITLRYAIAMNCSTDSRRTAESRMIDYSHETNLSKNPGLRLLWIILGWFFVSLGFIGAFLPVMPTTIFLILAAYFFARGSVRFYNWLLNNRFFGRLLHDWRAGLGIPLRAKVIAIGMITLAIGSSAAFFVETLAVRLLLIAIGLGVITYLLRQPTRTASLPRL